jgi:hypothetical protein
MSNPDTVPTETLPANESVTAALTPPPPAAAAPKNEGEKLLRKVARALQTAVQLLDQEEEQQYHLVIDQDWGPLEVISGSNEKELRARIDGLRREIQARHEKGQFVDAHIYVFRGRRFHLLKWPYPALVHGDEVIPLEPLEGLAPVIDETGSLAEPLTLPSVGGSSPAERVGDVRMEGVALPEAFLTRFRPKRRYIGRLRAARSTPKPHH